MKYFVTIVIIGMFLLTSLAALAQPSSTNGILLEIPKVTKNGESLSASRSGQNQWSYDESVLTLDDDIRYRWDGVFIDLFYQTNPTPGAGYLKVYINDDSSEDNLITEHGSSPLPIAKISDRLVEGPNTILLVYIDSVTKAPKQPLSKVAFSFNFENSSIKPRLQVLSPKAGVVLANGVNHEFKLQINNYSLTSSTKPEEGIGKLNIYYNEINQDALIGTINSSIEQSEKEHFVVFDSKDIEFDRIPDSEDVNLIFALTNVTGDVLEYTDMLKVKTNYNNSINTGLPRISIIEPRKDRLDLTVNGNKKFLLAVDNFELLEDFESGAATNGEQGYLQIFVDNKPYKTVWASTEFSLNEIGFYQEDEGQHDVRVQLVNPDYTKLAPEAVDSVSLVYVPEESDSKVAQAVTGSNDSWRVVIVVLVLSMIVGGILLLVIKG